MATKAALLISTDTLLPVETCHLYIKSASLLMLFHCDGTNA